MKKGLLILGAIPLIILAPFIAWILIAIIIIAVTLVLLLCIFVVVRFFYRWYQYDKEQEKNRT